MIRDPGLGAWPNDGAAVLNVRLTPALRCEVHEPHANEARLPLWHAEPLRAGIAAVWRWRDERDGRSRSEVRKGKKRQLTLPDIGSAAGTRASRERRTCVRKTDTNTFCCHGDRDMQLIIPHLVCVSSWHEADAGRGGAGVGVETKTFVCAPNDTRRWFPTQNLGGFRLYVRNIAAGSKASSSR